MAEPFTIYECGECGHANRVTGLVAGSLLTDCQRKLTEAKARVGGEMAAYRMAADQAEAAERKLARLTDALTLAAGAIAYAREPHHLDHAEECSLCAVATDHLDLALRKARAALDSIETENPT